MESFDVIVAGLGGMGSAAADHLARRGLRVLGLDRFPLAHDRGSSHGHTRLIRLAYFEHPDYVPLLRRATELWRELEVEHGRRLFAKTGVLLAGPPDGEVLAGASRSAQEHSIPVERLSPTEATQRWPGFRIPEDWTTLYEPGAGALLVEDCVRAHAARARASGATLECDTEVLAFREVPGGIAVETNRGSRHADRLVLCPGPWAEDLLQLPGLLKGVLRKSLFWLRPPGLENDRADKRWRRFTEESFPCFGFDSPAGFFYGTPAFDHRGVKVANHAGGTKVSDPLHVDRETDPEEQEAIGAWSATHLPELGQDVSDHVVCLYTMSVDGHFLLGLHPNHSRVAIAAGFSGHGFKFASVVGEVLADLTTEGRTSLPIGFLSPDPRVRQATGNEREP